MAPDSTAPDTNFGAAQGLRTANFPVDQRSFVRFHISGITGTVRQASLRLYADWTNPVGVAVRPVVDPTWTESSVTYNNAPGHEPVWLGWMNNWEYASGLPTSPWRGAQSLPRQITLAQHTCDADRLTHLLDVGGAAIAVAQMPLEATPVAPGETTLEIVRDQLHKLAAGHLWRRQARHHSSKYSSSSRLTRERAR